MIKAQSTKVLTKLIFICLEEKEAHILYRPIKVGFIDIRDPVFSPFTMTLRKGRTPLQCIRCLMENPNLNFICKHTNGGINIIPQSFNMSKYILLKKKTTNIFILVGLKVQPIAIPSICLYKTLLKLISMEMMANSINSASVEYISRNINNLMQEYTDE